MNFLEELAAEYFEYKGAFVRQNIKFGKRPRGGYIGEMDVVAYYPGTKELIHIETSTDSLSWKERKKRFQKKFKNAERFYDELFPFEKKKIERIAVVGFNKPSFYPNFGDDITVRFVPGFINMIVEELRAKDPMKEAVPENLPLLRAIQYSAFYGEMFRKDKIECNKLIKKIQQKLVRRAHHKLGE